MSISTEISRLQTDRNTIRTKLVELGMASNLDNLDKLAAAIEGLANQGAVSVNVKEGETYTIPKGYHNGSGTVSGISGGGNYTLQSKTVTPTKKQQNITSDEGFYGLSDVTVSAIPDNYQDVSSVTAIGDDVLTGKIFVTSKGEVVTGTMINNGTVSKVLDATSITYTIPKGFHSGTGTVKITLEEKTVTPSTEVQILTPTKGQVLSKVTVNAIPDKYKDTSTATAIAGQILTGATAFGPEGEIVGTMPNIGAATRVLDATHTSYVPAAGYHNGEGSISIVPETKTTTPTKLKQTIVPTEGKVLTQVVVNSIPASFVETTDANATAENILVSKTAYVKGVKVAGTMANNGDVSATIDGLSTMSVTIDAGFTTGGTISLGGDIESALKAI